MRIWIINPFDQLPNETDVPRRYWPIASILAEKGHNVIWWSSDFSHLTKTKRAACRDTDGFSVRLIATPPYTKNISFARLKNHKTFANSFYTEAMAALQSSELKAPDRIVVSLPPLGVAEQAFRIRDFVNGQPSTIRQQSSQAKPACEVIVDIKDAWPETFYQALPKPLRKVLGPILLASMHRSAKRAYQGADKISAVGQSYLDLASRYLDQKPDGARQCVDGEPKVCPQRSAGRLKRVPSGQLKEQTDPQTPLLDEEGCPPGGVVPDHTITHPPSTTAKPMLLCYHGTDLERFKRTDSRVASAPDSVPTLHSSHSTPHSLNTPLSAVYLGAMSSGYDLQAIIEVAARWKAENVFPFQIHFAGDGPQLEALKANSEKAGLLIADSSAINNSERIVFHGYLSKSDVEELLISSHLALVPNKPDSLVACPAKICELAAAGLPMLNCLLGELGELLKKWDAGSGYNEGDAASLQAAFENYVSDPEVLKQQSLNARNMAEALFDRRKSYAELAAFILANDSADTQ